MMILNRRLFTVLIPLLCFISCKKSEIAQSYPSYYGRWQFLGMGEAVGYIPASADTAIILTLSAPNTYTVTLNGMIKLLGTFQATSDTGSVPATFRFSNITEPYGGMVGGSANSQTYYNSNFITIGQLTLFQSNTPNTISDTLILVQSPTIAFEAESSYFKRF
jgi:hypothetical protein